MARHQRLILPGVAAHLIQRGNNRGACFRDDSDYLTYLAQLRALAHRHRCKVHVYCLMTNHVHLLLTPDDAESCSTLMRDLGREYVLYFNRRHGRSGTLWGGRFKSCIVESREYVLACYRYIESNPVRAGMVSHGSLYPWSSHNVNAGLGVDGLIHPHCEYAALAVDAGKLAEAYRSLFERAVPENIVKSIRDSTNGGFPLASEAFKSRLPAGLRIERGRPGPRPQPQQRRNCAPDPEFDSSGS